MWGVVPGSQVCPQRAGFSRGRSDIHPHGSSLQISDSAGSAASYTWVLNLAGPVNLRADFQFITCLPSLILPDHLPLRMRHPPHWVLPLCLHTSVYSPWLSSCCPGGKCISSVHFLRKKTYSDMEPTTNHLTYAFSKRSIGEARELSPDYSKKLSALSEPTKAMSNCSINRLQPISVWLHGKP